MRRGARTGLALWALLLSVLAATVEPAEAAVPPPTPTPFEIAFGEAAEQVVGQRQDYMDEFWKIVKANGSVDTEYPAHVRTKFQALDAAELAKAEKRLQGGRFRAKWLPRLKTFGGPTVSLLVLGGYYYWEFSRDHDNDSGTAAESFYLQVQATNLGAAQLLLDADLISDQPGSGFSYARWKAIADYPGTDGETQTPGWVLGLGLKICRPQFGQGCGGAFDWGFRGDGLTTGLEAHPHEPSCATSYDCWGPTPTYVTGRAFRGAGKSMTVSQQAMVGNRVPLLVEEKLPSESPYAACTVTAFASPCRVLFITDVGMEHSVGGEIKPGSAPGSPTPIPYTPPPEVRTNTPTPEVFEPMQPAFQDPCGQALFNWWVDPTNYDYTGCDDTVVPPAPEPGSGPRIILTLPRPELNETYTAYLARLVALGYVGTATTTVLASEISGYGPSAPVRIVLPALSPSTVPRTYDPLSWPATSPEFYADDDITIRYNPTTAAEVPTDPPPGGTPPTTPGIDFSPITGIDWGCKFPVGFICYAIDVTGWFNVEPDAPRFAFDAICVPAPGGDVCAGADGETFVVDLEVMDDYMSLLRTLMSVALWVGAVYLLATRLLGFKAGGDPGEAVDEGLNWQ